MEPRLPLIVSYEELYKRRRLTPNIISAVHKANGETCAWDGKEYGELDELVYQEILSQSEYINELQVLDLWRAIFTEEKKKKYSILHDHVNGLRLSGFMYLVFEKHLPLYQCQTERLDIGKVVQDLSQNLKIIHEKNVLHGNVHITYISTKSHTNLIRLCDRSCVMIKFQQYSESYIISPIQVILEMLSAGAQPDQLEYDLFKIRLLAFWKHLLTPNGLTYIIDVSKRYFSKSNGCVDYIDYCIRRYCQLTADGKYVLKSKSKILGYLKDIDLFALGISCHMLTGNKELESSISERIGECIRGDYPDYPDYQEISIIDEKEDKENEKGVEIFIENNIKKVRVNNQVRIVRKDMNGEYYMYNSKKTYF